MNLFGGGRKSPQTTETFRYGIEMVRGIVVAEAGLIRNRTLLQAACKHHQTALTAMRHGWHRVHLHQVI
jgi:hypothetical protein